MHRRETGSVRQYGGETSAISQPNAELYRREAPPR